MTTRAGFVGILSGLIATVLAYLFFLVIPLMYMRYAWPPSSPVADWMEKSAIGLVFVVGGAIAVDRSGAQKRWRCLALGALAGTLAGVVLFCLWSAAHAGNSVLPHDFLALNSRIYLTMTAFARTFGEGLLLGALGGGLASLRMKPQEEIFDLEDPQMAMNAFITAVPASLFTAVLAAAFFPRLADAVGSSYGVYLPLYAALLLLLISQFVLMLVVPHEARMAQHRCGTDEVKMAAFVCIATAPVLGMSLWLADAQCFVRPQVIVALAFSLAMSLRSVRDLVKVVLPRRGAFPAPLGEERQQAVLFGSIGDSKASRLVMLCTGCGLAMVLPLYVCVLAPLVNMQYWAAGKHGLFSLYLTQAAVSLGSAVAAIAALVLIYMVYLYWGKKFGRR